MGKARAEKEKRYISRRGAGFAENEKKNDAIQKMYYQTLRSLRTV